MSNTRVSTFSLANPRLQIVLVVLLALGLRIGHILTTQDWPNLYGGDYAWYAAEGQTLLTTGRNLGPPQTGPIWLLIAGFAEQSNPQPTAEPYGWLLQRMVAGAGVFPNPVGSGQMTIRLLNAVCGALTVLLIYRIGRTAWNHPTGLAAALFVAVNPIFILETGNLLTESLTLLLMTWFMALWLTHIDQPDWRLMAGAGALLALTALTRSVFLAFPAIPLSHLLFKHGLRKTLRYGVLLLIAFLLTISPWTLYNLLTWDRLTLTGEGLMGTLYVGAIGWQGPEAVDAELGFEATENASAEEDRAARQEAFAQGFLQVVLDDPVGYAARRLGELGGSLLQPHNTTFYRDSRSIKQMALDWLNGDRSPGSLLALMTVDTFWPKLLLYVFHYAALGLGIIGLWLGRRRWRTLWPLYAVFGYFLAIHLVLAAIPRYLFPLEPFWCLFGAAAAVALWERPRRPAGQTQSAG